MKKTNGVTYRQGTNLSELAGYLRAVGMPVGTFLLSMFIISLFGAFGSNLLAPMAGGM